MKKLMVLLSAFLLVSGIVGVSNATLYTDVFDNSDSADYNEFWGGTQLVDGDSLNWNFDIRDDGFDPFTEYIGSAWVEMTISNYWPDSCYETAKLEIGYGPWENEFTYNILWGIDQVFVGTLYVLDGLQDGWIHGRLTAGPGSSFWFEEATLYANAEPVPEPATMLLLGTGIVGLAGMGRKKFFEK